jgi:hypothetical protein
MFVNRLIESSNPLFLGDEWILSKKNRREFPQSYQFNLIKIQFRLRLFLSLLYSLPFLCYETMQNHINI